jgi:hypothetical protein
VIISILTINSKVFFIENEVYYLEKKIDLYFQLAEKALWGNYRIGDSDIKNNERVADASSSL